MTFVQKIFSSTVTKKIIKLKKTPEFYKCPICSKNVKEKKTEKEERHLVLFKKNNNFELIKL